MLNRSHKPFWHHVALGIVLFIVLSVVYVRLILPSLLGDEQIFHPVWLTPEFLSNANNLGGTLNAVTGLLSGVALILALYAVKIQSDGLALQAEGLVEVQRQAQIQAVEFSNANLITALDVYENRLAELTEKLKLEFSYPSNVDIFSKEEVAGEFDEFRRSEMNELINRTKKYQMRIYYLRVKLDESLAHVVGVKDF